MSEAYKRSKKIHGAYLDSEGDRDIVDFYAEGFRELFQQVNKAELQTQEALRGQESLRAEIARLRSIINERCLAIHLHDRTYGVRMWERWVVRELLADPWGPSTGESYELEEIMAMKEQG
jgi:hypothetical protein